MNYKESITYFYQEIDVYLNLKLNSTKEMNSYFESLDLGLSGEKAIKYLSSFWGSNNKALSKNRRKTMNVSREI